MSDIRVDFDTLAQARTRLSAIVGELETSGRDSLHSLEIDHGALRDAVREFDRAWRVRRERLVDELQHVLDSVAAVRDTFAELDADLARRVKKVKLPPAAPMSPNRIV